MSMISTSARRIELVLLVLAIALCTTSLAIAVLAGAYWFVAALAVAAAPVVIAWRLDVRGHR